MDIEQKQTAGLTIITIASCVLALAALSVMGCNGTRFASETIVEILVQPSEVVECDTDLDCMLKNPNIEPY